MTEEFSSALTRLVGIAPPLHKFVSRYNFGKLQSVISLIVNNNSALLDITNGSASATLPPSLIFRRAR